MNTMNAIIQQQPAQTIIIDNPARQSWLDYFDPYAALQQVKNHVETLPGSRNERYTMRDYLCALSYFTKSLGGVVKHISGEEYEWYFESMEMPTRTNVINYIGYCKKSGLKSSTIVKYMSAARHFIRAFETQQVIPKSGEDFLFIMECQRQFRLAASVKNPKSDTTSNRPALEQHGTRLNLLQINQVFNSFQPGMSTLPDITTITGKRDLALLYLAFTSGLRAAELARLKLENITNGDNCYEIRVRGKRNNIDPIGIDNEAHALIMQYVEAYNETLEADDSRRITRTSGLWKPLFQNDTPVSEDFMKSHNLKPTDAIKSRAILRLVERRSEAALGFAIAAHDTRRTCAYLMRQHGYEWDEIRAQLRHKSIATTEKYVGRDQNLAKALLSNRVEFDIPEDKRLL